MSLSQFPLTFHQIHKGMPFHRIAYIVIESLVLIGLVFVVHRNHFYRLYQKDKSSDSKVKFRQASNRCKRVLEAAKLAYANKTKESITFQELGSRDFWQIANSALDKGKSAIPPLFNGQLLFSASDIAKSTNSNLDGSGISLPVSPSITHLKLHIISVTPIMVKKVIMNLDLSKASGLLQEKGPSSFAFPIAFRRFQLSLTAFKRFCYINTLLKLG